MRTINKYKKFCQVNFTIGKFSRRVLNFNRPKWEKLQKYFTYNYKLRYSFKKKRSFLKLKLKYTNPGILKIKFFQWERVKKIYKKQLDLKRSLLAVWDNSINFRYLQKKSKKNFSRKGLFLNYIARIYYQPDIILWMLGFCKSSYDARQHISCNRILLNNVSFCFRTFLKKGDVLNVLTNCFNGFKKRVYMTQKDRFFSFIEVDYYARIIVFLKDFYFLNYSDFYLMKLNATNINLLNYKH